MIRPSRPGAPELGGLILVVCLLVAACGGGEEEGRQQARAPAAEAPAVSEPVPADPPAAPAPQAAPTGGPAGEITALLDSGRSRTFHARYTSPPGEGGTSELHLELWNKPPFSRLDVVVTGEKGISSSAVRNAAGSFRCARQGEGPWACQAESAAVVPDPAALLFDAMKEAVSGKEVTVGEESVGGRPGRCFADTADPAEAVCLTREGIPLRMRSGGRSVDLQVLETTVRDRDIDPPAKPASA